MVLRVSDGFTACITYHSPKKDSSTKDIVNDVFVLLIVYIGYTVTLDYVRTPLEVIPGIMDSPV